MIDDPDRLARWQQRIATRLGEIAAEAAATEADRAPVALDQQSVGRLSRMDAIQLQAMAAATERRRRAEAGRLRAALARIGKGEFGYCESCGEPIAEGRLAIDPGIVTCVRCAGR